MFRVPTEEGKSDAGGDGGVDNEGQGVGDNDAGAKVKDDMMTRRSNTKLCPIQ